MILACMKILTIVGARPQFVKLFPFCESISRDDIHVIVHTGQHYDYEMSRIFFDELDLPIPDYHLNVGSGSHGDQTGRMMVGIEKVLSDENPDIVVVFGDTNSTLAGALTAAKAGVPIAHVEAGLRSFNRMMPEEINRIVADHLSSSLLCPNESSKMQLASEGINDGVYVVGDIMIESLIRVDDRLSFDILESLDITPNNYILATIHRQENADNVERMKVIIEAMRDCGNTCIFPIHPRTRNNLEKWGLSDMISESENVKVIEPQGYLNFLSLEKHAKRILTDSGGVQKEAYFFKVPCVTIRDETEWRETLQGGWNTLTEINRKLIVDLLQTENALEKQKYSFGDIHVSSRMMDAIHECISK
jgi:UDP-N-acetylglucosamine 2-epimerase